MHEARVEPRPVSVQDDANQHGLVVAVVVLAHAMLGFGMPNVQTDKHTLPNKEESRPAGSRPGAPAKQSSGTGAEQAADNQKKALESGEENTT